MGGSRGGWEPGWVGAGVGGRIYPRIKEIAGLAGERLGAGGWLMLLVGLGKEIAGLARGLVRVGRWLTGH